MVNRFLKNVLSAIFIVYLVYMCMIIDEDFLANFLTDGDSSAKVSSSNSANANNKNQPASLDAVSNSPINLIVVSCSKSNYQGIREIDKPLSQAITSIKSAVLFATSKVHIHIFTEDSMKTLFDEELSMVKRNAPDLNFEYTIRLINYETIPESLRKTWKSWYKPCGSFRLLTPFILPKEGITQAIYADSDVIWTRPVDELWKKLDDFSASNVMGSTPTAPLVDKLTQQKEGGIKSYYDKNDKYILDTLHRGTYQINTGVLLMDFTKMLDTPWSTPKTSDHLHGNQEIGGYSPDLLLKFYEKYSSVAEHDQKLMNYVFHYNPELLYALPCEFNWKTDYCMPEKAHLQCKTATGEDGQGKGPIAIHGTTSAFYSTDHPVLKILFRVFKEFDWMTEDNEVKNEDLAGNLESAVSQSRYDQSYCAKKMKFVVEALRESSKNAKEYRKKVAASKKYKRRGRS